MMTRGRVPGTGQRVEVPGSGLRSPAPGHLAFAGYDSQKELW